MNHKSIFLIVSIGYILSACSSDNDTPIIPKASLSGHTITISDIIFPSENISFERVIAEIKGTCWEVISNVEAPYEEGEIILTLPKALPTNKLQVVEKTKTNPCGHWPATSSNPKALVAGLGEIIAYLGEVKVGRLYLSDWTGETGAYKTYIYYHYADRPFELTGNNSSYYYEEASFTKGWNAYANINPSAPEQEGNVRCTTSFSDKLELHWRFEVWRQ